MVEAGQGDHLDAGFEGDVGERAVGDDERGPGHEEQPLGGRLGVPGLAQRLAVGDDGDAVDPAQRARGAAVDAERARVLVVVGDVAAEIRARRASARYTGSSDAGLLVASAMCAPVSATSTIRVTRVARGR